MKAYMWFTGTDPLILNFGKYTQLQAPAALCLGKKPCIDSLGGWVGPRAGLNVSEKKKTSCTCQ